MRSGGRALTTPTRSPGHGRHSPTMSANQLRAGVPHGSRMHAPSRAPQQRAGTTSAAATPPLVLPVLVDAAAASAREQPPRGSPEPTTTAASVRIEAQRGLMEEWGRPAAHGGGSRPCSRGSSRASSVASGVEVESAAAEMTGTRRTPSAPRSGTAGSDIKRKVHRRRQVAEAVIDRSAAVSPPSPAPPPAGRPQSATPRRHSTPSASPSPTSTPSTSPTSPPVVVGRINGVPFQTRGDFGSLVDQWISTSTQAAVPPQTRLRAAAAAATKSQPSSPVAATRGRSHSNGRRPSSNSHRVAVHADNTSDDDAGGKQKTKVEKARVKMRRAVDKLSKPANHNNSHNAGHAGRQIAAGGGGGGGRGGGPRERYVE